MAKLSRNSLSVACVPGPWTDAPRWAKGTVAAVLLVHGVLIAHLAIVVGPTCDEPFHLAAGVRRLESGVFDVDLGNPPLFGSVAALPLVFKDVRVDWRHVPDSVTVGHDFAAANGPRFFEILGAARLACLPFTLLGAWTCFCWASRLNGPRSGLLALALWCFCPNILGHGSLVTGDVPATAVGLTAFYSFWNWLQQPTWRAAIMAGAWFGAAQLTKYIWICMWPAWPLIWVAWSVSRRQPCRPLQLASILSIGICLTNAGYLFGHSFRRLDEYHFAHHVLAAVGQRGADWIGALPVPLPGAYVCGIDEIGDWFERSHESYLRGRWSTEGWWYYYLYGLGVKVPLGTWAILAGASFLAFFSRSRRAPRADELFVLFPVPLILWFVTTSSSYQSHVRYVLPALPFLFIWASRIVVDLPARPRIAILVAGALTWTVVSSLSAYPNCISYFNELAGGTCNADKHLIDSNIDWGQDLHALRRWLDDHPEARPLQLAYFGGVDPRLAGIEYSLPAKLAGRSGASKGSGEPRAGWYAISVNFLRGLPFAAPDGQGNWEPIAAGQYSYLRRHEPAGRAGYSIRIYCVEPDRVNPASH